MARRHRRRHHRRHYRGLGDTISLPSLGSIKDLNPINKSVRVKDLALGALVGMVGGAGVKYLLNKLPIQLPGFVQDNRDFVAAAGAGLAAYALFRKKNKSRAEGLWVGALVAGAVPTAWALLRRQFPQLGDVVDFNLGGVIVNDLNGVIVNDLNGYADSPALADVAAHAMMGAYDPADILDAQ